MGPSCCQCSSCCCPAEASLWPALQVRLCGQNIPPELMPMLYWACALTLRSLIFQFFCAACFLWRPTSVASCGLACICMA